jgi:hypothetical protein
MQRHRWSRQRRLNIVTRAISGHAAQAIQHRYSTVDGSEMREGLAVEVDIAIG